MYFHSDSVDKLFQTILDLETIDECYAYFEDLCTVKEIQAMAQRLDTAIKLNEGMSYQNICKDSDISTATVGRVSRCLNWGSGGYAKAISKLKGKEENGK